MYIELQCEPPGKQGRTRDLVRKRTHSVLVLVLRLRHFCRLFSASVPYMLQFVHVEGKSLESRLLLLTPGAGRYLYARMQYHLLYA